MTISYARQWKRNGVPISGATGSTYQLVEDDEGAIITVTVIATNEAGSTAVTSAGVGPVASDGAPGEITIDSLVQKSGETYTFTARRAGSVSAARSATFTVSGATSTPALASDFGGTFPTGAVNFAPGAATATFTVTGNSAVYPE